MTVPTLMHLMRRQAECHQDKAALELSSDGDAIQQTLSYAELDARARAVGAALQQQGAAGQRVLNLCQSNLDFVTGLLGCFYAGAVAVPAHPPVRDRTMPRVEAIVVDAEAGFGLCEADTLEEIQAEVDQLSSGRQVRWCVPAEAVDPAGWQAPDVGGHDPAVIQYTSGSTTSPKGVVLTHANLLSNLEAIREAWDGGAEAIGAFWLPLQHDMGLIGAVLETLYLGATSLLMPPSAFIERPLRWLEWVSRLQATISVAPNFAYELCVEQSTPAERATLDLRSWSTAMCGAEPVRVTTLDRFTEAFAPAGFRRESFHPVYGLAEATLLVTGVTDSDTPPASCHADAAALSDRRVVDADPGSPAAVTLVGCGRAPRGSEILVVDPETLRRRQDDEIGEIWVSAPYVAQGYWRKDAATARTFKAFPAAGGSGPYLRTGDLGFLRGGELFVAGRLKDLIVIRGRNYYPDDIEATVQGCHDALLHGRGAAFSIVPPGSAGEQLVVVQEVARRRLGDTDAADLTATIRTAITEHYGIGVHAVALVKAFRLPTTSSGKIERHTSRQRFLDDELELVAAWRAAAPRAAGLPAQAPPASVVGTGGRGAADVEDWLVSRLSAELDLPAGQVDPSQPFAYFGLDSVRAVQLAAELGAWLGRDLSPTLAYEYPSIGLLARHLADGPDTASDPAPPRPPAAAAAEPIAVIGIGCRFPGADGPRAFWRLLCDGRDAITDVPAQRWEAGTFSDPDGARATTRWGGFLDRVDEFDGEFFGISPRESAHMDPQQRLLLEVAWEALEDAGQVPQRLAGSRTGVFVGISTNDYSHRQFARPELIDSYDGTGNALSIAANRLSYILDLRGASMAIDTACSSSLVAVHLACRSLWDGESPVALAGGVNLILSTAITTNLTRAGVMAPDGRCKSFDARADGYVRSEGAGIVVLKPLSLALADGDPIRAVIRGSAINQDGRTNGLLAPNPRSQEEVLRAAYQRAGLSPGLANYVEAHGTGTLLGDQMEARALGAVLADGRPAGSRCMVGSVKTNIGHPEAAAGIAGLIKVVLALEHRAVPASLHFEEPNPQAGFDSLCLQVPQTLTAWPQDGGPAVAGVSSFGFGGANAHVVLAEAPPVHAPSRGAEQSAPRAELLPLSARSPEALRALAGRYEEALASGVAAGDLCYTAGARRGHHDHRLALVGHSAAELAGMLGAYRRGEARPPTVAGVCLPARRPPVVFVFSGQGSQWPGMGQRLVDEEPVFRAALDSCDRAMREHVEWSLLTELAADGQRSRLGDIDVVQPALFAVQVALAALWRSWGVEPQAVVGHSMGEVAAAHVAGALALEDAVHVICERGRLLKRLRGNGGMVAVGLSVEEAEQVIGPHRRRVAVAASNSHRSTVLSGDQAVLADLVALLERREVSCRWVKVDVAAHGPQVEVLQADFEAALEGLRPAPAAVPMYSTVTGEALEGRLLDTSYWQDNLRLPVRFSGALRALLEQGRDMFLEISPHPVLLSAVWEDAASLGLDVTVLPSLRRDGPERDVLLSSLGTLYTAGQPVAWERLHPPGARHAAAPSYPWQRVRHWLDDVPAGSDRARRPHSPVHPLRGPSLRSSVHPATTLCDADIGTGSLPLLADHRVHGEPVVPAALYVQLVHAAARSAGVPAGALSDVGFHRPLVLSDGRDHRLQVVLVGEPPGALSFECRVRGSEAGSGPWTLLASGTVPAAGPRPATSGDRADPEAIRARCAESLPGALLYRSLAARGLEYGPAFTAVEQVWRRDGEAIARLTTPLERHAPPGEAAVDAALLDACFQVLGATLPAGGGGTYLPVGVATVELLGGMTAGTWCHARLRAGTDPEPDTVEGDVRLLGDDGRVLLAATGVRLQRLPSDAVGGAADLDGCYYEVRWIPAPLPAAREAGGDGSGEHGRWLLLSGGDGLGEALRADLEAHGQPCLLVAPGHEHGLAGPADGRAGAQQAERLRQLLTDGFGPGQPPCRGVVWVGGEPATLPRAAAPEALGSSPVLDTIGVVNLVQALVDVGRTDWPRLWVVTRGAQPLDEAEPVSVAQSTLWGLGRSIDHEHPELRCTRVDLSPRSGPEELRALSRELREGVDEFDVALRGERRYRARIVPVTAPPPALPAAPARTVEPQPGGDHRFHLEVPGPGALDEICARAGSRQSPGPGEVEIAVHAAGLNFIDAMRATGTYPGQPDGPLPLGVECAGTVTATGEGVANVRPGDAVIAVAPRAVGSFVTTRDSLVVPKPEHLGFAEAATIPIAFLTACYALHEQGRLRAGERVLIHSAAGGVGLAAVEVARWLGAEVFATAGSPDRRAHLRSLGVEHVMDSRSLAFADEVLESTGGEGVDVVLNSLTGEAVATSLSILAPYGRFVEIGKHGIYQHGRVRAWQLRRNGAYLVVDLAQLVEDRPAYVGALLRDAAGHVADGTWRAPPVRVFPLGEAAGALRRLSQPQHVGKVAVAVHGQDSTGLPRAGAGTVLRADATYLITGGLGGLARTVAAWMSEQGARHVVLTGRSAPSSAVRAELDRLRASGTRVTVHQGDVTEPAHVSALLATIDASMPPLRGVVHAAGNLDDGVLTGLDEHRIRAVMAPKVAGAWNVHTLTLDAPLDFFVLFSSAASLLGSPGQAHYAAANAFLDALAWYRRAHGLPALSINWGPWAEVGAATAPQQRRHLALYGVEALPPGDGVQALERLLGGGATQVAVLRADWRRFAAEVRPGASLPLLADLGLDAGAADNGDSRAWLRGLPPAERQERLESYLRDQTASRLGLEPSRLDVQQPLNRVGVDSLVAAELRSRIQRDLDVVVPVVRLLEGPSVASLAAWIAERLQRDESAMIAAGADHDPPPRAAPAGGAPAAVDLLARLPELGDDAVDDLLATLLAGGDGEQR